MARQTPQWLHAGSYDGIADRQLITSLWPAGGVLGCAVTPGSGMALNIAPGHIAVPVADGSTVLCTSTAIETLTLDPSPPSGTDRVDLVVATPRSVEFGGGSTEDWIFAVVKGAQGAPPGAAPAVPAGSLAVAQIHVAGGAATITAANIFARGGGMGAVANNPAGRLIGVATGPCPANTDITVNMAPDYVRGGVRVSGNLLVVPVTGIYQVSFSAQYTNSGGGVVPAGYYYAWLHLNAVNYVAALGGSPGGDTPTRGNSAAIALNAGDALSLVVNMGAASILLPPGAGTHLSASLVSI